MMNIAFKFMKREKSGLFLSLLCEKCKNVKMTIYDKIMFVLYNIMTADEHFSFRPIVRLVRCLNT